MRGLIVTATGPLATVQDLGRPGYAHLGVPHSGAADRGALRLANRLVGNRESAPGVEVTLGGFAARVRGPLVLAVTGPPVRVLVDGRPVGSHALTGVPDGAGLVIETPADGCRNYLAVRGGLLVPQTLGSASTDILSGLGPPPLRPGDELAVGPAAGPWPAAAFAPAPAPSADDRGRRSHELIVRPGPRADALAEPSALHAARWTVNAASNRIGVRLDPRDGAALALRADRGEQPSEGVPWGAVQVPPSGQPVLFLADHPVTGGYPVVATLTAASVERAAQLVPGDVVRLLLG